MQGHLFVPWVKWGHSVGLCCTFQYFHSTVFITVKTIGIAILFPLISRTGLILREALRDDGQRHHVIANMAEVMNEQ